MSNQTPNVPALEIEDNRQFGVAIRELEKRRSEGLRLWRPRPNQLPFLLSDASEKIERGGVRSGKTMVVAAEVGGAATRTPLIGIDGNELPSHYPTTRPLVIWVIGYDERHIGRIKKKLFDPGMYKCIRDLDTGELRAWRPWEESDAAREGDTLPSPPLIPSRLVDKSGWAWDGKVEGGFRVCRLKNGTEIHAFASGAEAGQGDAVDIIWIDEDIKLPQHVSEWQSRLSDNRGKLLWSVWPHSTNTALRRMSKRAKQQEGRENPDVFESVIRFSDNPFIPSEEKRKRIEGWNSEGGGVVRARDSGDFIDDLVLVFPGFNEDVHCLPSEVPHPDKLETFLRGRNYQTPISWTNYLVLDPGHTQPAVAFYAVPPPEEFGYRVVCWGEIYTPRIDAFDLADIAKEQASGRVFEDFIIDYRAGRQRTVGLSRQVVDIYSEAFAKAGLRSERSGSSFVYGSDDIAARNMIVRQWLGPGEGGSPTLYLIRDAVPNMANEFALYKKRMTKDDVKEEVVDKDNHLMDCNGYLAAYSPEYVEPISVEPIHNPAYAAWKKLEGAKHGEDSVYVGAGAAPVSDPFDDSPEPLFF